MQFLAAHRLSIYLGGLIAILLPRILRTVLGVTLAPVTRTVIVFGSLLLVVVTYLAERQVRQADGETIATESYSRQTRVLVGLAVVGLALGFYLALEGRPLIGLLFLGGAMLFLRIAYTEPGGE
jgi:hypothetical protein